MGDRLDCVAIGKLEPWDFVILADHTILSPEDAARHSERLRKADVPGLQSWMLSVPRRWYN
jgi:hypothetical protein